MAVVQVEGGNDDPGTRRFQADIRRSERRAGGAEERRRGSRRAAFQRAAFRVLTDLVGPYYTVVVETTLSSLSEYEQTRSTAMSNQDWRHAYQQFVPFVESGYREILTVLE